MTEANTFGKVPAAAVLGQYLPSLSDADAKVLLAMCSHAGNASATAYPSRATLAQMTGIAPRSVPRCLRRLEAAGAIVRLSSGTGRGRTSRYQIVMWMPTAIGDEKGDAPDTLCDANSDAPVTLSDLKGDAPVTPSDLKGDAPVTPSDLKGDETRPKGCHSSVTRIDTNRNNPPPTPRDDPESQLPTRKSEIQEEGEGADFQDGPKETAAATEAVMQTVNAAWRQATGVGLSAADSATLTAESGNGSAELLPLVTAEAIRAADGWRRERKWSVLNLRVVLMYLRDKTLSDTRRAQATSEGQGAQSTPLPAADAQAAAQRQRQAAVMAYFDGLPADRRESYLARARKQRPGAGRARLVGVAANAAWADHENETDEIVAADEC